MVNPGWADMDRGLFSISVAAELAGLHPQTLRIYEREGLLDPARSTGGTRRYSRRDIGRLQEICALTADGLNLAGIRRVLQLQEETRQLQSEVTRLRELTSPRPAQRNEDRSSLPAKPKTGDQTGRATQLTGRRRARSIGVITGRKAVITAEVSQEHRALDLAAGAIQPKYP
jgi:MerR family transcriptional regulator, heat shock protein HspR